MSLISSCSFDMSTDFAKIDVREDVDPRKASSVVEMMCNRWRVCFMGTLLTSIRTVLHELRFGGEIGFATGIPQ